MKLCLCLLMYSLMKLVIYIHTCSLPALGMYYPNNDLMLFNAIRKEMYRLLTNALKEGDIPDTT